MPRKSRAEVPPVPAPAGAELPAPNAGELDVLGVLWLEKQSGDRPLQLGEVYRRVCERRRHYLEPEPALTTVSTHLRNMVAKGLIEEVAAARHGAAGLAPER